MWIIIKDHDLVVNMSYEEPNGIKFVRNVYGCQDASMAVSGSCRKGKLSPPHATSRWAQKR